MDRLSREARSRLMSRVRSQDTDPEIRVRRVAHAMGLRFRLHRRDLPGCPDMVLPRHRLCVFVHGCFWHRHPECPKATTPKSHVAFWRAKFERNVARDAEVARGLRAAGWRVTVIWECRTRDNAYVRRRLVAALGATEVLRARQSERPVPPLGPPPGQPRPGGQSPAGDSL
jgi:DNA mismatch endonuclease (patch repair protein)